MNTIELQQKEMRAELAQIRAELEKLRATAEQEEAEQRKKFDRYLETLNQKSDEVSGKLDELKDSSGDALADIKTGMKEAWERLAIAKQAAKARFH